jgi:N-acylglucosamine 2-epimerase
MTEFSEISAEAVLADAGRSLADRYRALLLEDCVPFWFPRSVDVQHGGFLHCLDRDGTIVDTDKSVWAQGRMTWMLLTLWQTPQLQGDPRRADWLQWANSGLEFLQRHCFDRSTAAEEGLGTAARMFFHVTQDGRPIRRRRYAYSEAFAAIANAAYFGATGQADAGVLAMDLFRLFTEMNFQPGRTTAKFTETRPLIGLAPRMITIVTAQELRRHLGERPELTAWIDRSIHDIETLFYKPELRCVMECVTPQGEISDHFDGRMLNPGHAIEGAWFILEEGRYRGDERMFRLGSAMLEGMWERGWDEEFGGLFYFRDVYGKPVQEYWHDMKFWWPHDEALIGTLLAWKLTGASHFLEWHCRLFNWAFRHFGDSEHGEWYGYLHRDGRRSVSLKGNLWKSFFHHPRALWKCWQILTGA